MEDEIITLSGSSRRTKPLDAINILVVDDDTTCLSIIAAILKQCKYKVVTVKNSNDALYMLRIKGDLFDLVVTDVHMPGMNGLELQKAITEEFNLPVVLMSADDGEDGMLKGLETGAAFFITKPVSAEDVKDLWQYVAMKNKTKALVHEVAETTQEKGKSPEAQTKRDSKRPFNKNDGEEEDRYVDLNVSKKAKFVWTNELHNKFLEAISALGLNRAVPKKILEFMQVPELTRENVASHLQKYRINLKKVSDSSHMVATPNERSLTYRPFRPNSGSRNNSMFMPNKLTLVGQQGDANLVLTTAQIGNKGKDIVKGSSSDSFFTQDGFKQSSLLRNSTNTWKPSPLSQIGIQRESINLQGSLAFNGGISRGLTNNGSYLLEKYLLETPIASLGGVSKINDINKAPALSYVPGLERTTNMNSNPSNISNQLFNLEPLIQKGYKVANPSTSLEVKNSWTNNFQNTKLLDQNGSLGGFGGGFGGEFGGDNGGGIHYSTTNTKNLAQDGLHGRFGGGPSGDNGGDIHYTTTITKHLAQDGSHGGPSSHGGSHYSITNTKHVSQGGSLGWFGGGPSGDNGGGTHYSTTNTNTFTSNISGTGVLVPPSFGNGEETQPPIHLSPAFDKISTSQHFSLDDFTTSFFNELENPSTFQGIGDEGGINSNFPNIGGHMNNSLQCFDENYNQQGQACLTDSTNFGTGAGTSQIPMNNTTVPTASENDEDALLESLLASYPFEGEDNLGDIQ